MKKHEYKKILAIQNEYHTEKNFRKKLLPSFYFFSNMIRILVYCNLKAKKGIYDDVSWVNSSLDVFDKIERTGIKIHITGMHNIAKVSGPVVFIANHMSTLETMVLPSIIQPLKDVIYVIKVELSKYPLFGPIALARSPILVGRENPREDLKIVLEEGSKKIQEGKSVIIFPQKTRSLFLDSSTFNSLGIKLAKRNNVAAIPIALVTDAWGNGKIIKEAGKIDPNKEVMISIGEPFMILGNGSEEHQKVIDFISHKFKEWGRSQFIK